MTPQAAKPIEAHVTRDECSRPDCDWTGFHWHWNQRRFRTIHDLTPAEVTAFDEQLNPERNPWT